MEVRGADGAWRLHTLESAASSVREAQVRQERGASFADLLSRAAQADAGGAGSPHAGRGAGRNAGPQSEPDALREAVQQLEAYFLYDLLKRMRRTIPEGGLFKKGFSQGVYEEMMDERLAEEMAKAGGLGLGELLYRELSQHTGD